MPRYALLIEYDGTPFHGWQRQAGGLASVQGRLEAALSELDPDLQTIAAAGRTDTGVHASGQVAHVDLNKDWAPERLMGALNFHLRPDPVAVLAVAAVPETFHARFSALGRRYVFRLLSRRAPAALSRNRVWQIGHRLDLAAMQAGARNLIGTHDFTTFRASLCQAKSPVKTLDSIEISALAVPHGTEYRLEFAARSFLHNQLRSIVGTLERVGAGSWSPEDVARALNARARAACGPVAPPQGLCLTGVVYPRDPFA